MRFKIGTNTILSIASAGVSIQSLFTNGLTSNAFNNLVFDTPSGQKINFNIGGYNIGYVNSSALIFYNISSDSITSSDLNLNAPTSQKVNFNINNSASQGRVKGGDSHGSLAVDRGQKQRAEPRARHFGNDALHGYNRERDSVRSTE